MFDFVKRRKIARQPCFRFVECARTANQRNNIIERVNRFVQAFQNMRSRFRLSQIKFGATADNLTAKRDKRFEHLFEIQNLRLSVHNRNADDPERHLQLRHFVEFIENNLRHGIAFEFDDDADAFAVRFVADFRNAIEFFLVDEFGDTLDQARFVQLIRNFGYNHRIALSISAPDAINRRFRPHLQNSASFTISAMNFLAPVNKSARRKIRSRHDFD